MSLTDDTQMLTTLVCSGCDSLTPAADSFWLIERHVALAPGNYCRVCADKHTRGEVVPQSSFPRLAAFSIDGKTWTACDLRDSPS